MKFTGFGIADYRSFDGDGVLLRDISKINVLIGKNNCGKSNVLSFLKLAAMSHGDSGTQRQLNARVNRHRGRNKEPVVTALFRLDVEPEHRIVKQAFEGSELRIQWQWPTQNAVGPSPLEGVEYNPLVALRESLTTSRYSGRPSIKQLRDDTNQLVLGKAAVWFKELVQDLVFIPAIREVQTDEEAKGFDPSGRNIIRELRSMQHPLIGQEDRQNTFSKIERFVADLINVADLRIEIPSDEDDIYLNMYGNRLPLRSYGTGIHELVIICSTLSIHENVLVCIEEPEIHLHPELIRKFVRFLESTTNRYLIATHSNVLLDAGHSVSIYHIKYDGEASRIERKETDEHVRMILDDLAYRASDLLQTNGIIWVEGPSDRTYLKRWLELSASQFVEGIHYSIMFYGGANLAHLSAARDEVNDELIDLLRVNRNAIVMIDRDGASSKTALREYKRRIQQEIGRDSCWVTKGREIENYLSEELLTRFLQQRFDGVRPVRFGDDDRIEASMSRAVAPKKVAYDKVRDSKRIAEMMTGDDLNILDLPLWLNRIGKAFEKWNP